MDAGITALLELSFFAISKKNGGKP